MYDSQQDTQDHIRKVQEHIFQIIENLTLRAQVHDASKLVEPEKSLLSELGSQTNLPTYGSAAERARFDSLAEFRQHHYARNTHHPEHYPNGIVGMSLLDIIEMLCDWHAAVARHIDGNIHESLTFNRSRFNLSDEMFAILENTIRELNW